MANAGLVIGWKDAKVGREAQAMELFAATMSYYTQLVEKGEIESFEPVVLTRHGGDLNGFVLVRGTLEQIDGFRRTDAFRKFQLQAILCLEGFGVVDAYLGDRLMEIMGQYGQLAAKG